MTFGSVVLSNCTNLLSMEILDSMSPMYAFFQSVPFSPKMVLTFLGWVKTGKRRNVFEFCEY